MESGTIFIFFYFCVFIVFLNTQKRMHCTRFSFASREKKKKWVSFSIAFEKETTECTSKRHTKCAYHIQTFRNRNLADEIEAKFNSFFCYAWSLIPKQKEMKKRVQHSIIVYFNKLISKGKWPHHIPIESNETILFGCYLTINCKAQYSFWNQIIYVSKVWVHRKKSVLSTKIISWQKNKFNEKNQSSHNKYDVPIQSTQPFMKQSGVPLLFCLFYIYGKCNSNRKQTKNETKWSGCVFNLLLKWNMLANHRVTAKKQNQNQQTHSQRRRKIQVSSSLLRHNKSSFDKDRHMLDISLDRPLNCFQPKLLLRILKISGSDSWVIWISFLFHEIFLVDLVRFVHYLCMCVSK